MTNTKQLKTYLNQMKTKRLYRNYSYRLWFNCFMAMIYLLAIALLTCMGIGNKPLLSPKVVGAVDNLPSPTVIPTATPTPNLADVYVDKYARKFTKTNGEYSHRKAILHCLLYRESTHGFNKGMGDNGMAGGPLQFWEGTWQRMRGQMKAKGLIREIKTRFDLEPAIETTSWAISQGYGNEWGPILRKECK